MKRHLSHPDVSRLVLALLSLGTSVLPSMRAAKIAVARRAVLAVDSHRRSRSESRR